MLQSVRIRNYRSLKDVTLRLGELTILIGPNDSGKSTVLDALHRLGLTTERPILPTDTDGGVFESSSELAGSYWLRNYVEPLSWEASGSGSSGTFQYALGIPPLDDTRNGRFSVEDLNLGGRTVALTHDTDVSPWTALRASSRGSGSIVAPVATALKTTHPFSFVPNAMRQPSTLQDAITLNADGSNLAGAMDVLMTSGIRGSMNAVEETLREKIPSLFAYALRSTTLRDVELIAQPPTILGNPYSASTFKTPHVRERAGKALEFVMKRDDGTRVQIPATQVSDGALFLTAFLLLAYGDTPDTILIEEPENGLHPSRLGDVVSILRDIASGAIGDRPRQIVLTTHSPLLLNLAQPDEVRVVRRNDAGDTTLTDLKDVPEIPEMLEEFGMGELWYLLGEQKLAEGATP